MNKSIIGLCGVIGSGKDYWAGQYVEQGYTRIAFADTLRRMCEVLFGFEPEAFNSTEKYEEFKAKTLYLNVENFKPVTGRLFLQLLGTEAGRKLLGEDVWVKALFHQVAQRGLSKVVIPDVRFPNEAYAILNNGGKLIFCDYHSQRYNRTDTHESEKMSQELLARGLKDGQEINWGHFPHH